MQQAEVTPTGLKHDRQFVLVDSKGNFLSQRREPKMSLIEVSIEENILLVTHPGLSSVIIIPFHEGPEHPNTRVDIWGKPGYGIDVGHYAAEWFGDYLGLNCRLLRYDFQNQRRRLIKPPATEPIFLSFADGFPLLLTSEESLIDLNGRLAKPVTMERFRPNIVVTGARQAYDEDGWSTVSAGSARLVGQKPCERCAIPNIDPATGIPDPDGEPIKTLKTYRGNPVLFGKNLSVGKSGEISVGAAVDTD